MDPANTEKLENLILSKLEELEKSGFSSSAIEAAVNTIEFRCVRVLACVCLHVCLCVCFEKRVVQQQHSHCTQWH